jgi:hypothetical protein
MNKQHEGPWGSRGPQGQQTVKRMIEERMLLSSMAGELTKLGVQLVTVEYPGFVNIPYPDGAHWAVGMANGPWGMTLYAVPRHEKDIKGVEFPGLRIYDVPEVAVEVAKVTERTRRERFTE